MIYPGGLGHDWYWACCLAIKISQIKLLLLYWLVKPCLSRWRPFFPWPWFLIDSCLIMLKVYEILLVVPLAFQCIKVDIFLLESLLLFYGHRILLLLKVTVLFRLRMVLLWLKASRRLPHIIGRFNLASELCWVRFFVLLSTPELWFYLMLDKDSFEHKTWILSRNSCCTMFTVQRRRQ